MIYRSTGGSLSVDDPTYVERKQDTELSEKLLEGEYCYVFNSRQMGKSSLRVKVMDKLNSQGCQCISIDMSMLSDFSIPKESWYDSFLTELFDKCDLENNNNFHEWIAIHRNLSNLQRWKFFIEEILFTNFPTQKIYIFLDEIDTLGKCYFKDEFLGFIRSCYNRRAENKNSDYHRLVFGFFGAVTPGDLIKNRRDTPFNVGYGIELTELTFPEAKKHLTQGLEGYVEKADVVLQKVFDWTGGQPFLTQKLCQIIVDHADNPRPNIDKLVEEHILNSWEDKDNPTHLKHIQDYLLSDIKLLKLYQKILKQGEVKFNNNSQIHISLRLSGIVLKKQDKLVVFNKIYQTIFNQDWVAEKLPGVESNLKLPQPQSKKSRINLVFTVLTSVGIVILLRSLGLLQSWEWTFYDHFFRLRPAEPLDPRIVIVGIDESDIRKYGYPINDRLMAEILQKLHSLQPRTIGLDIHRDSPREPGYENFLTALENIPNIIGIERIGIAESLGIKPPAILAKKQQVGFNNIVTDPDGKIRRGLLYMHLEDGNFRESFPLKLALNYLKKEGIEPKPANKANDLQLGLAVFHRFKRNDGAYVRVDEGGYKFLANPRQISDSFHTVSMSDLLSGKITPHLFKDRIILIGYTATSVKDFHRNSYSSSLFNYPKEISGVELQANFLSQILSSALDGRVNIKVFPEPVEWLLIIFCSYIGAKLSWQLLLPKRAIIMVLITSITITGISYIAFIYGWWVPILPSIFSLSTSAVTIMFHLTHFGVRANLELDLKRGDR